LFFLSQECWGVIGRYGKQKELFPHRLYNPSQLFKKKKARKREKPLASKMFNLVAETHVQ
jgi:hypothetical protein